MSGIFGSAKLVEGRKLLHGICRECKLNPMKHLAHGAQLTAHDTRHFQLADGGAHANSRPISFGSHLAHAYQKVLCRERRYKRLLKPTDMHRVILLFAQSVSFGKRLMPFLKRVTS
jgi:hypothetical protein